MRITMVVLLAGVLCGCGRYSSLSSKGDCDTYILDTYKGDAWCVRGLYTYKLGPDPELNK